MVFGVWCSVFGGWNLVFGVQYEVFKIQGLTFSVKGLGFRDQGLGDGHYESVRPRSDSQGLCLPPEVSDDRLRPQPEQRSEAPCVSCWRSELTQCITQMVLESQLPHKIVNLLFLLVTVTNKLTIACDPSPNSDPKHPA